MVYAQRGNILLIRLKSLGDIVLTFPAVALVREAFPDAKIAFLVSKEYAPLLEGVPGIDETIALDRATYRKGNPKKILVNTFQLVRRLRQGRFSLVVDFQGYGETALLTRLCAAGERWGRVKTAGGRWAYTNAVSQDAHTHPATWNLSFLKRCGLPDSTAANTFVLPKQATEGAQSFFAAHGLCPTKPTLYLQPFTSRAGKNWPFQSYLQLAGFWRARGVQVVFGGGPTDRAVLQQAATKGFTVAGGLPLLTAAGVMQHSTVVVGGDTGFVHLAVSLGKRVLMLLRKASPGTATPVGHPDWTIVPPIGETLEAIPVEAVVKAILGVFGGF